TNGHLRRLDAFVLVHHVHVQSGDFGPRGFHVDRAARRRADRRAPSRRLECVAAGLRLRADDQTWAAQARTVIRIVVTGGTFDKTYDEINGRLSFGSTHLPEMLRLGRSRVETTTETLMMIDSLDMTDADRARIVDACARSSEDRIIITHGTDTIVDTARAVAYGVTGKTVVLTG